MKLSRVISCPYVRSKVLYFGSHKAHIIAMICKARKKLNCNNKPKNIRVDIENVLKLTLSTCLRFLGKLRTI